MTNAGTPRNQILNRLETALGRKTTAAERRAAVEAHLASRRPNLVPERGRQEGQAAIDQFVAMAEEAEATIDRVFDLRQVPAAVSQYLRGANLPLNVRRAPDPALDAVPWDTEPLLQVSMGAAVETDGTSVTGALCAVSETGTLMLVSGDGQPTTLNFLPENHVVILRADQIVGSYEAGWASLRDSHGNGADGNWSMPRNVNFITGPSRSADIEQTLQLGAHGPRRLHIILVEDGARASAPPDPDSGIGSKGDASEDS